MSTILRAPWACHVALLAVVPLAFVRVMAADTEPDAPAKADDAEGSVWEEVLRLYEIAKEAGEKVSCKGCHKDMKSFELTNNAVTDLEKWM